jgi:hypothetical protein
MNMLLSMSTLTLRRVNPEGEDEVRAILRSSSVAQESGGAEAVVAAGGVYVRSMLTFYALNNIIVR